LPARIVVPTIISMSSKRLNVLAIVSQQLEDAASLRSVRSILVRGPHVRFLHLGRTDERLLAHLDGLSTAGDEGCAHSSGSCLLPLRTLRPSVASLHRPRLPKSQN
jgi:hypothetical protein